MILRAATQCHFPPKNPTINLMKRKKVASYSNPSHTSIIATKSNKILTRNNFTIKYCNKEISKSYEGSFKRCEEGRRIINGRDDGVSGTCGSCGDGYRGGDEEDDNNNGGVRDINLRT